MVVVAAFLIGRKADFCKVHRDVSRIRYSNRSHDIPPRLVSLLQGSVHRFSRSVVNELTVFLLPPQVLWLNDGKAYARM
jgi:hypothetical protein